jgi:hypothetical protein
LLLAGHLNATGVLRLCCLALMMTMMMQALGLLTQQQDRKWAVKLVGWQVVQAVVAAAAAVAAGLWGWVCGEVCV